MLEPTYDDEGWPHMQWFGESWGAPACEPDWHAETPVGEPCAELCGDSIEPDDQGFLIPHLGVDVPPTLRAYHRICFLRSVGVPTP